MTESDNSDGKWQKIRWENEAEANPKAKKRGANSIHMEEIWEFTALSNMISLYFQNSHSAINVGMDWNRGRLEEGRTARRGHRRNEARAGKDAGK